MKLNELEISVERDWDNFVVGDRVRWVHETDLFGTVLYITYSPKTIQILWDDLICAAYTHTYFARNIQPIFDFREAEIPL